MRRQLRSKKNDDVRDDAGLVYSCGSDRRKLPLLATRGERAIYLSFPKKDQSDSYRY
jgi:hypothetical protein